MTLPENRQSKVCNNGPTTCLYVMVLCLVPLVTIAFVTKFQMPNPDIFIIYIDTQDEPLHTLDSKFLSLGLDSTIITDGFPNFNMTNEKLVKMIGYLAPAYLRIGGNQADQIVFSLDKTTGVNSGQIGNISDAYILKASDWLKLNTLAKEANIEIIYDLNSLLRNNDSTWNSENAKEMIKFSHKNKLQVNWELGNEPNSYPHKFNMSVNATQLGLDYHMLRELLDSNSYNNSLLIGPSTTRLRDENIANYLLQFLISGSEAINALTFHHYYFSGQNATWEEFLNPANFDYLEYCIDAVKSVIALVPNFDKPIWLGETSSAWHGGAPNMSDRFIGTFLWIDKLGLSAKMGIDLVIRQSVFKGNYALIDDSYHPNPDWWLSILYKKLVGSKVITTETEGDAKIRLYAHCAKDNSLWRNTSAVVVFGVNLDSSIGLVQVKELRSEKQIFVYELTSENTLISQSVRLNDQILKLGKGAELPELEPRVIERETNMEISPYSIVFWIFTNTNVEACSSQ
ncbi:hypothetical protein ABEB36_003973 [Hypothenemus hampei]|uniref:Heparanase n=1 Tax=Hypothenemus hampei TaxID=57062 RepID=A0ABD1F340_HYPHA